MVLVLSSVWPVVENGGTKETEETKETCVAGAAGVTDVGRGAAWMEEIDVGEMKNEAVEWVGGRVEIVSARVRWMGGWVRW
jgi:hypothetical protein